jgi:hypothetical protein
MEASYAALDGIIHDFMDLENRMRAYMEAT